MKEIITTVTIYFHRDKDENWEIIENLVDNMGYNENDISDIKWLGSEIEMVVEIYKDMTAKLISIEKADVTEHNIDMM